MRKKKQGREVYMLKGDPRRFKRPQLIEGRREKNDDKVGGGKKDDGTGGPPNGRNLGSNGNNGKDVARTSPNKEREPALGYVVIELGDNNGNVSNPKAEADELRSLDGFWMSSLTARRTSFA